MTAGEEGFQRELVRGNEVCGGRYTIVHRISCGGFATVYAAKTRSHQDVALKILDSGQAAKKTQSERMENEMKICAALFDVPNVVRPLDHGIIPELDSRPFIAFELVQGASLARLLTGDAMPSIKACEIARIMADTLAQLHARGVVHRDVKPSNILVEDHDGLRVRLIDFGFAFSSGVGPLPDTSGVTRTFELTGTVHYMAPEHCMAAPPTPHFDIYGLACTLWEMVVGHNPYLGHDPQEVLRRKLDRACPTPSIFDSSSMIQLDDELAELIDRGMRRNPKERIASAEEFRDRLDSIIERLSARRGGTLPAMAAAADERPRRLWWPAVLVLCSVLGGGTLAAYAPFSGTGPRGDTENHAVVEAPVTRSLLSSLAIPRELHVGAPASLTPMRLVMQPEVPSPEPSRASAKAPPKAPRAAKKPVAEDRDTSIACTEVRADLRAAQQRSEWVHVLQISEARPDCWSKVDRALLRIRALRTLGRYRACVAEGQNFSQTEVQRGISSCRARLEER